MIVFRGSQTDPDKAFAAGFSTRHDTGGKGIVIRPGGQVFGGVSTSTSVKTAMIYAAGYTPAYVYAIYAGSEARYVDVLAYFEKKVSGCCSCFSGKEWLRGYANAEEQQEIHFERILPKYVMACKKVEKYNADRNVRFSRNVEDIIHWNGNLDSSIPQTAIVEARTVLSDNTITSSTEFSF